MTKYIYTSQGAAGQKPPRSTDATAEPTTVTDAGLALLDLTAASAITNIVDTATGAQIATAVNGILAVLRANGFISS